MTDNNTTDNANASVTELIKLARGDAQTPEKQEKLIEMMESLSSELSSTTFRIRDVDFKIKKLNAMDSWDIFDETREVAGRLEASSDNFNITDFLRLPHEFVKNRLLKTFLPKIDYCIKTSQSDKSIWVSVDHGIEHTQLSEKLEAVDIYELLLRSVFVNFTKSVKLVIEKIKGVLSKI